MNPSQTQNPLLDLLALLMAGGQGGVQNRAFSQGPLTPYSLQQLGNKNATPQLDALRQTLLGNGSLNSLQGAGLNMGMGNPIRGGSA